MNRILPTTLLFLLFLAIGCKKNEDEISLDTPSEANSDFAENNGWSTMVTTDVQYSMASIQGRLFRSYQPQVASPRLAVSSDDGTTWSTWHLMQQSLRLMFADSLTGFSHGMNATYRTLDGGHTWNQLSVEPGRIITFPGTGHIFGWGNEATYISEDQGATWTDAGTSGPGNNAVDLDFTGSDTCYAAVLGGILRRSTDAGGNWENVLDLDGQFRFVRHYNGLNGVAVFMTSDGVLKLLYTTDGWLTNSTGDLSAMNGQPDFLWFDRDGTLYAGRGPSLYRSTDDGQTWTVDLHAPLYDFFIGIVRSGNELWVWCDHGLAHKTVPL